MILPSELLITPKGRIYHLNLKPEQIADTIFLVGDPGRVDVISNFLSYKECVEVNREFVTVTGIYKGERITIMSTGIGVGNIDIAMNELDALVNIDFKSREEKAEKKVLNIVRIGTSGALQANIPLGGYIISRKAIGLDGMLNFQQGRNEICDLEFEQAFSMAFPELKDIMKPYIVSGSDSQFKKLENSDSFGGITITAPGFYGCQGRVLRMDLAMPDFNNKLEEFNFNGQYITNYEMETSALFGYSKLLGHEATTICLAIANRPRKEALKDYKNEMLGLIDYTLDSMV